MNLKNLYSKIDRALFNDTTDNHNSKLDDIVDSTNQVSRKLTAINTSISSSQRVNEGNGNVDALAQMWGKEWIHQILIE